MSEKVQKEMPQAKNIIKRRLNNMKKQYLVLNDNLYEWKNENTDMKSQIRDYDESIKNVMPYFPAFFQKKNVNVKIALENKRLKIYYNQIEVNQEIHLSKQARLEIIQQLQKTFRPHKEFVYTHEKDKEKVKQMLKEHSI